MTVPIFRQRGGNQPTVVMCAIRDPFLVFLKDYASRALHSQDFRGHLCLRGRL